MFLVDAEIKHLLASDPGIVDGFDPSLTGTSAQIQPASIDLRVGDIYSPEAKLDELGSVNHPRSEVSLHTGATAVVTTKESCNFPDNIGAIGFPPASVSSKGLLMTNPGHVDPGYHGNLSFTVINMGSKPYSLRTGDKIVTLLLFKTSVAAVKGYSSLVPPPHGKITDELLDRLSPDFLDVEKRAADAAKGEETKTRRWALLAPLVSALLAVIFLYLQSQSNFNEKLTTIQTQIAVLHEKAAANTELKTRIAQLEQAVRNLQQGK